MTSSELREMIVESIRNILLNEGVGNRIQVTRDEILDILNKTDEDPKSGGKWATITYVHTASVYKQKRNMKTKEVVWRNDDVQSALDKHSDRSGEDWHKSLSAFNQEDNDTKSKNPVSKIVLANRYLLHWHTQEDYGRDSWQSGERLRKARMSIGVALDSDGYLGDNHNQRQKFDYGAQQNQTGNLSRDFNMAKMDRKRLKSFIFLCDDNGDVITELPEDVYYSMIAKFTLKPEKEVEAIATPEQLEAYMEVKRQELKNFNPKNLLFDRMLCIAASVNGQSYYYINDALSVPISKNKGAANINRQKMIELAKELLDENFEVLDEYAQNKRG